MTEELPGPAVLEEQGWAALATSPQAAVAFYDQFLDAAVEMLLPGGMRLDDRDAVLGSMGGPPWAAYEFQDLLERRPSPDTAVVTYGVTAQRDGSPPYSALVSSVYVRRDAGWRLVLHQQTPR
jgi:Domain of unknown function (DUF4440)